MADQVDLLMVTGRAEVFEKSGIGAAVAFVAVLFTVDFAVVDPAAVQLCIEDTAAVPEAVEGADRRRIDLETFLPKVVLDAVFQAKVVDTEFTGESVFFAPADEAVDENGRIVVHFAVLLSVARYPDKSIYHL